MLHALALALLPACFVVDNECRPYLEEAIGGAREKLVVTLESDGSRFVVKKARPRISESAMDCLRYSASKTVPTTTEKRTLNVHFFAARPRQPTSAANVRPGGIRGELEAADQNIVCADRAAGLASQIEKACFDNANNRGRGRVIVDWRGKTRFDPPELEKLPEGRCAKEQIRGMEDALSRAEPLQLVAYAESGAILYKYEQTVEKCEAVMAGIEGYEYTLQYFAEEDDVIPTYAWFADHTDVIAPCFADADEMYSSGYAIALDRDRRTNRFTRIDFVGPVRPFDFRAICIRRKLKRVKLPPLDGRYRDVVVPISIQCLDYFRRR